LGRGEAQSTRMVKHMAFPCKAMTYAPRGKKKREKKEVCKKYLAKKKRSINIFGVSNINSRKETYIALFKLYL